MRDAFSVGSWGDFSIPLLGMLKIVIFAPKKSDNYVTDYH